jgi:hypothetical protein
VPIRTMVLVVSWLQIGVNLAHAVFVTSAG